MKVVWERRRQILTRKSLGDFFVYYDIDLDTSLSGRLEHAIDSVRFIFRRRSPKV